jgi:hypothetical protein
MQSMGGPADYFLIGLTAAPSKATLGFFDRNLFT